MKRYALIALAVLLNTTAIGYCADAAKDATAQDQTDNDYYWKGTQLYNLGRLGDAFDSFEKAIQRKQNTKEAEAYLLQIRQEIVSNAKKRAEERATLNYGGDSPDSALNVQYVEKGYVRVTLQAKFLFDENTASLKTNSIDVLNRLADLVQTKSSDRIELVMLDDMELTPMVKDIDAERALLVYSYINFKRLGSRSI